MASIYGSRKNHPALAISSSYTHTHTHRPSVHSYQSDYYLQPRFTWSGVLPVTSKNKKGNLKWKIGSSMLIISVMLVLITVLAVGGLALWMGGTNRDNSTNQKVVKNNQQSNTMITKNGLLRSNRNKTIITSPKVKIKPIKIEPNESDIDFSNIPTVEGTYEAAKANKTIVKNYELRMKNNSLSTSDATTSATTIVEVFKLGESTTRKTTITPILNSTLNELKHRKNFTTTREMDFMTTENSSDLLKDFIHPVFETSPWKPIVPDFINTTVKLPPGIMEIKTLRKQPDYKHFPTAFSTVGISSPIDQNPFTQEDPYDEKEKSNKPLLQQSHSTAPTSFVTLDKDLIIGSSEKGPIINVSDAEKVIFPSEKIVPEDIMNFRLNSKFSKNQIAANTQQETSFPTEVHSEIEMSGQIPMKTYNLHLKTSSGFQFAKNSPEVSAVIPNNLSNRPRLGIATLHRNRPQIMGTENIMPETIPITKPDKVISIVKNKSEDNIMSRTPLIVYTDKPMLVSEHEEFSPITGPPNETEFEISGRNRFSHIESRIDDKEVELQDEKTTQESVYTSYGNPNFSLNEKSTPSLINDPEVLKPFRHTIPVNKITSAFDGDEMPRDDSTDKRNDSLLEEQSRIIMLQLGYPLQNINKSQPITQNDAEERREEIANTTLCEESTEMGLTTSQLESKEVTNPENHSSEGFVMEMAVEVKNLPLNGTETKLSDLRRLAEPNFKKVTDNESILQHWNTTGEYMQTLHPLYNKDEKSISNSPSISPTSDELQKYEVNNSSTSSSKNSIFTKINAVIHTPNDTVSKSTKDQQNSSLLRNNGINIEAEKRNNDTLEADIIVNGIATAAIKGRFRTNRTVRSIPKKINRSFDHDNMIDPILQTEVDVNDQGNLYRLKNIRKRIKKRESEEPSSISAIIEKEQIRDAMTSVETVKTSKFMANSTEQNKMGNESISKRISWPENRPHFLSGSLKASTQSLKENVPIYEGSDFLLEKLKAFAQVRTNSDITGEKPKNSIKKSEALQLPRSYGAALVNHQLHPSNLKELKKIARISTGNKAFDTSKANETLKYTFSRV